jgi:hypothetical protein
MSAFRGNIVSIFNPEDGGIIFIRNVGIVTNLDGVKTQQNNIVIFNDVIVSNLAQLEDCFVH